MRSLIAFLVSLLINAMLFGAIYILASQSSQSGRQVAEPIFEWSWLSEAKQVTPSKPSPEEVIEKQQVRRPKCAPDANIAEQDREYFNPDPDCPQEVIKQFEQERLEREKQQRLEREKQQRLEREKQQRLEREEQQRLEREEQQRIEREEQQRLEREEQQRLKREEQQRLKREEQQRLKREEQQRIEREEQQRIEREKQQRIEREEQQRLKRENQQRLERKEQQRIVREKQQRLEREKQQRIEREKEKKSTNNIFQQSSFSIGTQDSVANSGSQRSNSSGTNNQNASKYSGAGQGHTSPLSSQQVDNYKKGLRMAIEKNKRYPRRLQRMRVTGNATVGFTVQGNGRLTQVHIISSSGNQDLDNAALDAVKHTGQYKPTPNGQAMSLIIVELSFKLR